MRPADVPGSNHRHVVTVVPHYPFWKATLAALALVLFINPGLAIQSDTNTLLLLHFESNLTGEAGETPASASGVSYEQGIVTNGANFAQGNQVFFPAADNILATAATTTRCAARPRLSTTTAISSNPS